MVSFSYKSLYTTEVPYSRACSNGTEHFVHKRMAGYLIYNVTICNYAKQNRKLRLSSLRAYQTLQ